MTNFYDDLFIKEMREIIYQFSPSNPHRDGFIIDRKAQTNLVWYWGQLGQYMRDAEMEYNRLFLSTLESQEKRVKAIAEVKSKTSVQYENFKRAKTLYETVGTLIHSVKREAEQLEKEVKIQ